MVTWECRNCIIGVLWYIYRHTHTSLYILLGWSYQVRWEGCRIWHAGGEGENKSIQVFGCKTLKKEAA